MLNERTIRLTYNLFQDIDVTIPEGTEIVGVYTKWNDTTIELDNGETIEYHQDVDPSEMHEFKRPNFTRVYKASGEIVPVNGQRKDTV